jgi:amino acid/amide ABC transporter substrate-binding protein, HAAT family (TC 3.A.1.4.-)
VFYQDDAYGMAGLTGVQKALAAHNLKPVATGTVKRNTVDVAGALASILPSKPDLCRNRHLHRSRRIQSAGHCQGLRRPVRQCELRRL